MAADASGKKKKKRAVTTSKRAAIAAVFAVVVIVETSSNPALSDGMSDGRFSRGAARPQSEVRPQVTKQAGRGERDKRGAHREGVEVEIVEGGVEKEQREKGKKVSSLSIDRLLLH